MAAWTAGYSDDGMLESAVLPAVKGQIKGMNGAQVEHFRFDATICSNFSRKCVYLFWYDFIACRAEIFVD